MRWRFLISLFLLIIGCATPAHVGHFNIDTSCDLAIVEGEINGKKTYFIIDTGAAITMLDVTQSKYFGFSFVADDLQIGGFTNNMGQTNQAIGIRSIKISGLDVTGDIVYTSSISNLVKFIEICSHKRIGGIIGLPILKKYSMIIDMTNNKIYPNQ